MPHDFSAEISLVIAGALVAILFVGLVLLVARRYPPPKDAPRICVNNECGDMRDRVAELEAFLVSHGITPPPHGGKHE